MEAVRSLGRWAGLFVVVGLFGACTSGRSEAVRGSAGASRDNVAMDGCAPATCSQAMVSCGRTPDGCGGFIDCGDCEAGTCSEGRCVAPSVPAGPKKDSGTPTSTCKPGCKPNESCVDDRCVCQRATCSSLGLRCGAAEDGCGGVVQCGPCVPGCKPDEMECCGACIPKAEGRCPENVHCPAAKPLPTR
ncbi:hypothetical protein OV208_07145 [Corallococcus sp. bb12-1]|uniref:hypothetical protein n=1 Tax=Corallococcus sp. bb12-1 TaxID=2996784 RepID=UPI00226D737B|nr:hypothetical protein [Corallococcus sp. bb12-1]MCY1041090.1 hypothetical protein [Corallococcus sp. bb12-1]